MDKVKTLFNHPRWNSSDRDPGLYEWKRPVFHKDDIGPLNRFLKKLGYSKRAAPLKSFSGHGSFHVRSEGFESNRRQRVISKLSYGCSKHIHLDYIKRYMPQLQKETVTEKPELFGTDLTEYEEHLVPFHYKIIISPENQNVDLKVLSNHFIRQLENLTGYHLYWGGAIHKDTGHKHVHLAINGLDKNGQKVRFSKEIVKEKMRAILCDAATKMVGERTYEEIAAEKFRLPLSPRWTKLDEKLFAYNGPLYTRVLDVSLQKRLSFLWQISLAEKNGELFTLKPGWKEKLQTFGRYNTFMTEYLSHNGNLKLFQGGFLRGTVEKTITFDKDESWNDAVVVQTENGRVYVPVFNLYKRNLEGKTIQIDMPYFDSMRKISDKEISVQKISGNSNGISY
ncbi:MAG: hypothetical protein MJ185_02640 [Treponema sp.]|nr:hypothetical protein [Treponema sp.]